MNFSNVFVYFATRFST